MFSWFFSISKKNSSSGKASEISRSDRVPLLLGLNFNGDLHQQWGQILGCQSEAETRNCPSMALRFGSSHFLRTDQSPDMKLHLDKHWFLLGYNIWNYNWTLILPEFFTRQVREYIVIHVAVMLPATSSPPLTWWLWYHQLCWRNGILSRQGQSLRDALCTEPLFCDHLVQNTMSRSRVALVRPRGNKRSSNFWVWCWMEELPTYIDELLIFVHTPVLNPSII